MKIILIAVVIKDFVIIVPISISISAYKQGKVQNYRQNVSKKKDSCSW